MDLAPKHILVCGRVGLSAVLPGVPGHDSEGRAIPAFGHIFYPVLHPAYILRLSGEGRFDIIGEWERNIERFARCVFGLESGNLPGHCIFKSYSTPCKPGKYAEDGLTCPYHRSKLAEITSQWIDPGIQQRLW
jgi:hypothetical protein